MRLAAINNLNQAVGSVVYSGWDPTVHGVVPLHLNRPGNLDHLIDPDSGWSIWGVNHLNDKGEIVGWGKLSGNTKGIILKPQD